MTFTRIATGDALTVLRQLPSNSVHSIVTSPPYWQLRDYEIDGQIGMEATPEEYLNVCWQSSTSSGGCSAGTAPAG